MHVHFLIALLYYALHFTNGLKSKQYQAIIVHQDSVRGVSPIKCSLLVCAAQCLSQPFCKGFYVTNETGWSCKSIQDEGLVPVTAKSQKMVKVFVPTIVKNQFYSHFIVIREDGAIQDFSEMASASPPITTYPSSHLDLTGGDASPCILEKGGSMTCIEKKGGQKMLSWSFDGQAPSLLSITMRQHGQYPLSAYQNGKLFILGGRLEGIAHGLIDIYENGQVRSISTAAPDGRYAGCAAFLPREDNIVYFGGGVGSATGERMADFWMYNINADIFTAIPNVPTGGLATQACVGATTNSGEKIFVVLGGLLQNSTVLSSVFKFSPSTQSWSPMTPMPEVNSHLGAVFWKGYIYAFAGFGKSYVIKMLPEDGAQWVDVGSLNGNSQYPTVVPYS